MSRTTLSLVALSLLSAMGCASAAPEDTAVLIARYDLDAVVDFADSADIVDPDALMDPEPAHDGEPVLGTPVILAPDTCNLEDQRDRLVGEDVRECGHVAWNAPYAAAEFCASEAFSFGEAFVVTYDAQAIHGPVTEMISGSDDGSVFFTIYDESPCGGGACAPSVRNYLCVGPAVSDDGRIGCDSYRPLIEVRCG